MITVNFGSKSFLFDLEYFYINQTLDKLTVIENQEVEVSDLDYIIREYMVHCGYQESFKVLDSITGISREKKEKENQNLLKIIRKESVDKEYKEYKESVKGLEANNTNNTNIKRQHGHRRRIRRQTPQILRRACRFIRQATKLQKPRLIPYD